MNICYEIVQNQIKTQINWRNVYDFSFESSLSNFKSKHEKKKIVRNQNSKVSLREVRLISFVFIKSINLYKN